MPFFNSYISFISSLFLFIYFSVHSLVTLLLLCFLRFNMSSIIFMWVTGGSWRKPSHTSLWPGSAVPTFIQWHGESSWYDSHINHKGWVIFCQSFINFFKSICSYVHWNVQLHIFLFISHLVSQLLVFISRFIRQAGVWCRFARG